MRPFCGLLLVLFIFHDASCENLVRQKRFFNSLWPSEEVKSDVQSGIIYSQLPPDYIYLLPGVNDHLRAQRRSGVPAQPPQPSRFIHPTRMAILMQPHHQQPKTNPASVQAPTNVQQNGPKIVMKPLVPTTNLSPSITLKTKEQSLPDIHKNTRFVQPRPVQKQLIQTFNPQQHLPIKKAFDTAPLIISSTPILSIKTAPISDFYYTKEFQNLLKEFNINVEISKLPPISDVMAILGTDNADETLNSIHDVAKSKEGMELIKGYLDQNNDRDDGFYNYDEDVGTGEIQVKGGSEDVNLVQNFEAPQPQYNSQQPIYRIPSNSQFPSTPNTLSSTTGTLTGSGNSWWRPTTWFSSSPSTKVESLQKDAEILQKVVPKPGSVWDGLNYIGNFLTPSSKDSVPINPPFNVVSTPRHFVVQNPFTHSSSNDNQKVMPTVRMTEAQFQDMIQALKLTPMQALRAQPAPTFTQQQSEIKTKQEPVKTSIQPPVQVAISPPTTSQGLPTKNIPSQDFNPNPNRFLAPIIVEQARGGIPLPSTLTHFDNRRTFISVSEPQRAAPYDFIATGRIHQANPDEVLKKSRSLMEAAIEGNF